MLPSSSFTGKPVMFINTLLTHPVYFFRVVAIIILSITLHELAHGVAALSQGDDTPRRAGHLTLNPLVHMGWESLLFLCVAGIAWGQMPVNPHKFRSERVSNMLVAAAGPLSNLALAIGAIAVLRLVANTAISEFISLNFLHLLAQINLTLFVFNFLPVPPLDGFHFFSELFPDLKLLEVLPCGLFLLMVLVLLPGFSSNLAQIGQITVNAASGVNLMGF